MKNLTTGHSLKLIFFFALPLMFGNLLQQLYIMVDTMIVGRFVGVDALASIGGADWINWAILGLLMGFTQGFSIRVSNCLGQHVGHAGAHRAKTKDRSVYHVSSPQNKIERRGIL